MGVLTNRLKAADRDEAELLRSALQQPKQIGFGGTGLRRLRHLDFGPSAETDQALDQVPARLDAARFE